MRLVTNGCKSTYHGASRQNDQRLRSPDHGDPTAQIRRCSGRASFLRFLCETELLLQSGAHIAGPIFQKCSDPVVCDFEVEAELSLQSCAFFADNFPRSSPELAEIETLSR